MHILVADQDVESRTTLATILKTWGHQVTEALSESEVMDLCREKCPDLIFLNKELSGVSGILMARKIRQIGGQAVWVPLILIGKHLNEAEILQGLDAGIDDFLAKPIPEIQLRIKTGSAARHLNLKEEVFSVAHHLVIANRALENVAIQDTLTGMGNSNGFDDALEREWFQNKKNETPLTLWMINLDYFLAYNQNYGVPKGDELLKQFAELLKTTVPPSAFIARIAGDTFAVLLPNTKREEAVKIAETLRSSLDALKIPHSGSGCCDHVTASLGGATEEPLHFTSPWDLKEAADFALYQAKHHGRNRVYMEPTTESKPRSQLGLH